jgi:hypothetical protein
MNYAGIVYGANIWMSKRYVFYDMYWVKFVFFIKQTCSGRWPFKWIPMRKGPRVVRSIYFERKKEWSLFRQRLNVIFTSDQVFKVRPFIESAPFWNLSRTHFLVMIKGTLRVRFRRPFAWLCPLTWPPFPTTPPPFPRFSISPFKESREWSNFIALRGGKSVFSIFMA